MIANKSRFFIGVGLFILLFFVFIPFPNNWTFDATVTVMGFPIQTQDGIDFIGIICAILFFLAAFLLYSSLKKYQGRLLILAILLFFLLPNPVISLYQETLAHGINAISYDNNGSCEINSFRDNELEIECEIALKNRSNKPVSFEIEFLESYFDSRLSTSLLNLNGPYVLKLYPNEMRTFHFKETIDVRNVSNYIEGGSSSFINFILKDGEKSRIF